MNRLIVNTLIVTLAVGVGSYLLPGVHVNGVFDAVIVAVVLALLNNIVKPILIILTIPVTIITLGLFLIVLNAMIILLADWVVDGFEVDGFWWALAFSVILAMVKSVLGYGKTTKEESD